MKQQGASGMVLDDLSLKGKVALITGGGSGIGGGITRGLAEAGASIACVYGHHEPTEMRQYIESIGGEFLPIHADVSDMKALPVIMEKTLEQYGRLDILVNNAGICPRCSALEYTEEMWDQIIQLNQKSVFFLSQLAARQFVKQKSRGKIINLASMMSFLGGFNTTAYTASKSAVAGLTRVCASEWGALGINVNALAPGWSKRVFLRRWWQIRRGMNRSKPAFRWGTGASRTFLRGLRFCWPAAHPTISTAQSFRWMADT